MLARALQEPKPMKDKDQVQSSINYSTHDVSYVFLFLNEPQ